MPRAIAAFLQSVISSRDIKPLSEHNSLVESNRYSASEKKKIIMLLYRKDWWKIAIIHLMQPEASYLHWHLFRLMRLPSPWIWGLTMWHSVLRLPSYPFFCSIKTVEIMHGLDMASCRLININLQWRNICVYLTYYDRLMMSVLCA